MRAIREVYKPLASTKAEYSVIPLTQGYTALVDCPILAAAARDVLAAQLHGEFAVLNFHFQPVA